MRPDDGIGAALEALRAGRPVLVLDDEGRENEGDIVLAAQTVTTEWMAWTIRHSSGYVCAPMPAELAERLALPPMVSANEDPRSTAYTVTVDAAHGITTGISAADRTRTVQLLADPATTAADLIRPGHVVPLRARPGGVLERGGHTEAAVDLCRLAGLAPVGVIAELVHDTGEMMRADAVEALGAEHGLVVTTVAALQRWRSLHDRVAPVGPGVELPTGHGLFSAQAWRDRLTGDEHLVLSAGQARPDAAGTGVLVRLHSECLTGDVLGSRRCDCGEQLDRSLAAVAREGGHVVYLRGHEGRGVGLVNKLAAYAEQQAGADTVEAQQRLGLPVDARDHGVAAAIVLALVGADQPVRLLTNNPDKVDALRAAGLDVTREPLVTTPLPENARYLETKRTRLRHELPGIHAAGEASPGHQPGSDRGDGHDDTRHDHHNEQTPRSQESA